MSRRVTRTRQQPHFRREHVIGLDQLHEPSIKQRLHRISHRGHLLVVLLILRPKLIFLARHEISGSRKRWHPSPVFEHGIPTDMIDVQVSAYDGSDIVSGPAGGF